MQSDPLMAKLIKYQAENRLKPTRAERRFSQVLRKKLNLLKKYSKSKKAYSFRTQAIFVNQQTGKGYIADFYIPDLRLVVEIDGPYHTAETQQEYDQVRSSFLASLGIKVVRFTNSQTFSGNIDLEVAGLLGTRRQELIDKLVQPRPKRTSPKDFLCATPNLNEAPICSASPPKPKQLPNLSKPPKPKMHVKQTNSKLLPPKKHKPKQWPNKQVQAKPMVTKLKKHTTQRAVTQTASDSLS